MRVWLAALVFAVAAAAQSPAPAPAADEWPELLAKFSPLDLDGDGTNEIESLTPLGGAGAATAPCVVVCVEARLLADNAATAPWPGALRQRLLRFCDDLAQQGLRAELLQAQVYAGPRHQDGRTVLALRRVLRAAAAQRPLAGAVLVGHFPDALLLRTCNWRRGGAVELEDREGHKVRLHDDVQYLRAVPELVAHKCDLVLADLDGDWEGRYFEGETALPSVVAQFATGRSDEGEGGRGGACTAMAVGEVRFRDAFHVHDGRAQADRAAFTVDVDDGQRDAECSANDRTHGNAMARPDIAVSRLDARGVAWSPKPEWIADGSPRSRQGVPSGFRDIWAPDPQLELRLLVEYFDRNHAFRTQPEPVSWRKPASVSWGLGSGIGELRAADAAWSSFAEPGYDVAQDVDLCAVLAWLRRPAVLRTLRAHSNGHLAAFAATDVPALLRAIGGPPWSWQRRGDDIVPSLAGNAGGAADFFFYRTLWQDHALPACPYLLVHTGCEALSPPGADTLRYDDERYGQRQHAESMLFFTPCLAIVGRAKVFYDEPRGFCATLAEGGTFGEAWRRYFEVEAGAKNWDEVGGDIGRKRAYFWSLLGDFTLRLPKLPR